jgi:hypothetical protein
MTILSLHLRQLSAASKRAKDAVKQERCWCMDAVFTPAVMGLVPDQSKGKACICAKCASAAA